MVQATQNGLFGRTTSGERPNFESCFAALTFNSIVIYAVFALGWSSPAAVIVRCRVLLLRRGWSAYKGIKWHATRYHQEAQLAQPLEFQAELEGYRQ